MAKKRQTEQHAGEQVVSIGRGGPKERGNRNPRKVTIIDRRRVDIDGKGSATPSEPNLKPSYVELLEERVTKTKQVFSERVSELEKETKKSLERLRRDLELRFEEREASLLKEVLYILDDLDRARLIKMGEKALREGFLLIAGRVEGFLKKHHCKKIEPDGEEFDPLCMEAISMAPGAEGRVVSVLQPGYSKDDKLFRPARVVVGNGDED